MAVESYRRILDLLSPPDGECFKQLARDTAKCYYKANGSTSAINIIEEAFSRQKGVVSKEDVSVAAEIYISNKQVITDFFEIILERETFEERTSELNKGCI